MSHDPTPPRDPFLGNHYIRNPQHAEEVRRMEIGKVLQYSLLTTLPLTATARVEAFKLLGEAGMMVDDDLPTGQLLELYVMYVAPGLPPLDPFRVDEVA
jgi:hypothetical protein